MEVKTVGVYGAGLMGRGIAQVALEGGYDVVLYNHRTPTLEKGVAGIQKGFDKKIAKGKITEEKKAEMLGRLKATTDLNDLANVDIVFEAMIEDMELKKDAFAKLAPIVKPEAIFVSNTSSLSITELATASLRPEKFLGMHFFSPVPAMKLVEIINAYDTSADTIETGKAIAKGFGKEFVTVTDVPMFIANRVMCPMMNEAAILAGENVCSYEDIDKACELGYNLPMGPLKLADAIGIDIMISVMESLYQETADSKYRPAHLYKVLYRAGRLGRKSGKGFYDYTK
ncbi:3-hydroxyacyl-CoA dehydrogenase family protein [Evtepia sp.]|jgi:3-hydroxybutyryl-CoA dehydrogenase|uniref:3-hydroxyacyl-CoA dehydrogenase family protein n=1 Tax=Evtepia sp. TaxID=2773933 RepID=UPI00242102A0|nr:3-hydroxyacyl-CoA dehydrogenase NAD-binding domain-containing protein [Evtepia sp.]MBS4880654.1 3-hydroxybutyryl-CoA dehydrogenase [Bacillota bacterium]MDD7084382.1 3-hydroxyacyl-CoA dehydrogenase NAD-binding domain-containing protein [Clostridiales bacterium]MEE0255755.1 3-hydroxyacyl-CoA dehydrogenase NAD-binding domain-containing protein [Evtepia sp.]MEE1367999.1 3-hydroxyacyl-CoA dehydrogenase NAD-binding domain-containing protein [Evtepia sp.]